MPTQISEAPRNLNSLDEIPSRLSDTGVSLADTIRNLDLLIESVRGPQPEGVGTDEAAGSRQSGLLYETGTRLNMLDTFAEQIHRRVNTLDGLLRGQAYEIAGNHTADSSPKLRHHG